ncbi:MAG: hotdog domain-containing protein [Actinomycetota bacterium]
MILLLAAAQNHHGLGAQIVVTGIETRFLSPGVEGDELVVETWVDEIKRVSTLFGQRIMRGDEVLATQRVRGACTTLAGRPTRFPAELLEGMQPYVSDRS